MELASLESKLAAYTEIKAQYLELKAGVQWRFPKVHAKLGKEMLIQSVRVNEKNDLMTLEVLPRYDSRKGTQLR